MGRTPCCEKLGVKKGGPWTEEEDNKLMQHIKMHGPGNSRNLPKNAGLQRCGKSCRLRWTNYLRPDIKRGRFSFEEEETIIQLHSGLQSQLDYQEELTMKSRTTGTHIRKRLLRMGLDPVTHSPRHDLLDLSSIISSAQLNLSNLLGLQTLVNPELVRLVAFLASTQQNPEFLLPKPQEDKLSNTQLQYSRYQEVLPCTSTLNQEQALQGNIGQFSENFTNLGYQNFQENLAPSSLFENVVSRQNCGYCGWDEIRTGISQNCSFETLNNDSNNSDPNFFFDSVMSTPLSSPRPLNSSPTFINNRTEGEKESYCSNMFKFEIPESLDFDDFM